MNMDDAEPIPYNDQQNIKLEKENDPANQENVTQPAEHAAATKSGNPKIEVVSLIQLFTPQQVREHIQGLRQWVAQVSFLDYLFIYVNGLLKVYIYSYIYKIGKCILYIQPLVCHLVLQHI